jgi:hypothetical protein
MIGFVEGVQRYVDSPSQCMLQLEEIKDKSQNVHDAMINCILFNWSQCEAITSLNEEFYQSFTDARLACRVDGLYDDVLAVVTD